MCARGGGGGAFQDLAVVESPKTSEILIEDRADVCKGAAFMAGMEGTILASLHCVRCCLVRWRCWLLPAALEVA